MKVSAEAGRSDVVDKTSVESTAQDDNFQKVRRRKGYVSNNALQTAKNLTKPPSTSAVVKLPQKAVLTRKFFAPFRTTDIGTEASVAENTLLE